MMSHYERIANRLTIFLSLTLTGLSIAGAVWLPNPTAIHYNMHGQPDRWGNPATLLILPVIVYIVLVVLWAVRKAHPDLMNFPGPRTPENVALQLDNIRRMLASLRVVTAGLFLGLQGEMIWAKVYKHDQLTVWLFLLPMAGLLGVGGFFVWRAYKLIPRQ